MTQMQRALRITLNHVSLAAFILIAACTLVSDYPFMKEGQPHAEAIVAMVARDWKAKELIKLADPELLNVLPRPQIEKMITECSRALGRPKQQQTLMSSSGVAAGAGAGAGKFASYIIELQCEKATAKVKINLRKADNRWLVLGFWVDIQAPRPI